MLNPKLHLNPKLFDPEVEKKATRNGYGEGLLYLGDTNPDVVALSADLTESTQAHLFAKKFPERFFQVGVAEQNLVAIAAGLGISGKIAFASSFAAFSPGKNWETIRTTCVYNKANVKIAGHHAGIITGADGATHQITEDIAITRVWPDMHIYVPCDSIEARKTTVVSADINGPVYLRFTREKTPIITTDKTPFAAGKMQAFWTSEKPLVTVFATGYLVYNALLAAKELEKEGIQTLVANVSTVKPLDEKSLLEFTKISKAVVTVEDHQVTGGLGGAIAEALAKTTPLPIEFIGLQNTFGESGDAKDLLEKYGLEVKDIKSAVRKVIKRKSTIR